MEKTVRTRKLRAGDWVRVRTKSEILGTLDGKGCLDGLPFMPEMFEQCGKTLRVYKRAHKTCDTVHKTGGRSMTDAVHLDGSRCDGSAHGGCQAACLIFWKYAWLEDVDAPGESKDGLGGCSEDALWRAVRADSDGGEPVYMCQATRLPVATTLLSRWDFRQYWEDYRSGNVSIKVLFSGASFAVYERLINLGIGWGSFLRKLYNVFQRVRGGVPYPRRRGKIPAKSRTPAAELNLQPGELVRVKSYDEILSTLDENNQNRGLYFDCEEVPYCGDAFRVSTRVERIINEQTGKMMVFKNPSVILEGAYCQARYSCKRMFCPRAIYPMWREIWLDRVETTAKRNGMAVNSDQPFTGSEDELVSK